jgi:hypothetical protein
MYVLMDGSVATALRPLPRKSKVMNDVMTAFGIEGSLTSHLFEVVPRWRGVSRKKDL